VLFRRKNASLSVVKGRLYVVVGDDISSRSRSAIEMSCFRAGENRVSQWSKGDFMWRVLMVLAHKVAGPLRCRVFEPGEIEYLGGDIAFFGRGAWRY
jgi:hypothetical protein